jgi:hypothetical protein
MLDPASRIPQPASVPDWLVITADKEGVGRGVRGYALAWFLRTYFGRRAVEMQTPAEVRSASAQAETVFVGLPTSLDADELRSALDRSGCRRVVSFDYLDRHQITWTAEQAAALGERTNLHLKPWREQAWDDGLRHGLLPLRFRERMHVAITMDRMRRAVGRAPRPKYDVAFLGRPNRTKFYRGGGKVESVDQRVQWLSEIRRDAPELVLFGGFTDRTHPHMTPEVEHLRFPRDKEHFFRFWRAMRRSRVLLAPGGNVPWTYRHYECLYAGGVVVTLDYSRREMLIPLPLEHMVQVPDGAPALPAVRQALELSRQQPKIADAVYAHLDQYLDRGAYRRTRPKLLERFLAQLE